MMLMSTLHKDASLVTRFCVFIFSEPRKKKRRTKPEMIENAREKHPLLPIGCSQNCRLRCCEQIRENARKEIHESYWQMDYEGRRMWMLGNIKSNTVKTRKEGTCRPEVCLTAHNRFTPPF